MVRLRIGQEKILNITLVGVNAMSLPFEDKCFDLVLLSGVLEWIPTNSSDSSPGISQLSALQEINRVLKDGGVLYLATKNRFGRNYVLGGVDDHTGIRLTPILPRTLARLYMKFRLGKPYRTYLYSPSGLASLCKRAGFKTSSLYTVFPSYRRPEALYLLFSQRSQLGKPKILGRF